MGRGGTEAPEPMSRETCLHEMRGGSQAAKAGGRAERLRGGTESPRRRRPESWCVRPASDRSECRICMGGIAHATRGGSDGRNERGGSKLSEGGLSHPAYGC